MFAHMHFDIGNCNYFTELIAKTIQILHLLITEMIWLVVNLYELDRTINS